MQKQLGKNDNKYEKEFKDAENHYNDEYYYYNKNFDITKYIVKYRKNLCVYRNVR
jgi:hypothetical protein